MVDPTKMCRQHLLGEHQECHSFVGVINKWRQGGKGAIKDFCRSKYVTQGLVEIHTIGQRHEELSKEMVRRGYHHNSVLPPYYMIICGKVDVKVNEVELSRRCKNCRF